MTRYAITRAVSASLAACELTHQQRIPIDLERARSQHAAYEACLQRLGCEVIALPEQPDMPDAVFVEDTAVVFDEVALLTRPGASSRRAEIESVAATLRSFRDLVRIVSPGTVDGGDVLVLDKVVYVGRSSRTNEDGIRQMQKLLAPFGYSVRGVQVTGCLHLKSAATAISDEGVLVNPAWVDARAFDSYDVLEIHPEESFGANGLRIGASIVYPLTFPRTAERLEQRGIHVEPIDLSELAKAEGAVTCCSLVFQAPGTIPSISTHGREQDVA